jgi:hypothetical protein
MQETFQREFVLTTNKMQVEIDTYKRALLLIEKIGTRYSGFGKSCAEIARCTLNNQELNEQTKKTIKLIEDKQ